jgi:hypothetical protein
MKNKYTFELIGEKDNYSELNKDELFYSMLELTKNASSIYLIETFSSLVDKLSEDRYFIAHNLLLRKGGKVFFQGEIIVITRGDLINFLAKLIEINDLRDFLISPVFDKHPSYVVSIYDDSFYYCK